MALFQSSDPDQPEPAYDPFYPGGRPSRPGKKYGNPIPALLLFGGVIVGSILLGFLLLALFGSRELTGVQVCDLAFRQGAYGQPKYSVVTSEGTYPISSLLKQREAADRFQPGSTVDLLIIFWSFDPLGYQQNIIDGGPSDGPTLKPCTARG